jgi:hypothetical protein
MMTTQVRVEYTRELDYEQVCHCCGGELAYSLTAGKMWCVDRFCSAYGIRFTIPYKSRLSPPKKRVPA